MSFRVLCIAATFALVSRPLAAQARPDSVRALDTVRVAGRSDDLAGIARSASEGHVGAAELRSRPLTREGELLETVPGVIVTQHSGDGKANQYFVRGFNLDHGTDFQTSLEGMPLNLPTNAHGQGYTDLNFLIPELIGSIDYELGVSHADVGDFGSAGAASFHLVDHLEHPLLSTSYGQNGFSRLVLGESWHLPAGTLLLAGEGKTYDGPWVLPEQVRKLSGVARYTLATGASQFSVLALAYHNSWRSSDQIPLRAVAEGLVPRFGELDTTDGGATQRYSLSAAWQHVGATSVQRVNLYGVYSDLALFSDFTYFLDDPVRGDQFAQAEHRAIVGGSATQQQQFFTGGTSHTLTVGLQARTDIITGLALDHTQQRVVFENVRRDDVRELGTGAFADLESHWTPAFRSSLGLRTDAYLFDVTSNDARNSGQRSAAIVSPKAGIAWSASDNVELYLNGGFGFHSNDARGVTISVDPVSNQRVDAVSPLVRSRGAEIGLRATPVDRLRSTITVWALDLDSELLFSGDAGSTEASAASRRRGVTFANYYRVGSRLALDADLSFAHAALRDTVNGGSHVPGALENVLAAGVTWTPAARGAFGAIRIRRFGSYPLQEDDHLRAAASTLVNGDAGYQLASGTRVQFSVLNVFNVQANDIQYAYASRLRGETSDGVDDVHFHPAEPRQVRAEVEWRWF